MSKLTFSALFFCTKVFLSLLQALPTRVLLAFCSQVGVLVGVFCPRDRSVSIAQLRRVFPNGVPPCPSKIDEETNKNSEKCCSKELNKNYSLVTRNVFWHVGRTSGEFLIWRRFFNTPVGSSNKNMDPNNVETKLFRSRRPSISSPNDDLLENVRTSGRGAVGLSAHLGCYELCAAYLASKGLRCSVIGRLPNYPVLAKLLVQMRLDYGVELIWRDAPDSGRQIIKALKDGRVVCALLDQDSNLTNSFAPFFGIQAASPSGPIQLAIRHRVPLFTSFIVRTSPLEHRIETVEIPYDLNDQQAAQKALEVYNQRLESFILRYPDQWIWWHRRWRRRPNVNYKEQPELLRSTEEYIKWLDSAV